jgi:hypothetical protein
LDFYVDPSQIADFRELQLVLGSQELPFGRLPFVYATFKPRCLATSYNASTWSQANFWRNSTTWSLKDGAGRDRRGIGVPVVITDVQASTTCRFNQ